MANSKEKNNQQTVPEKDLMTDIPKTLKQLS